MAHHTEQTGCPPLAFAPGMTLTIEARSPTTDAEVAGVQSQRWSIYGYDESDEPPDTAPLPPILVLPTVG